MLGRLDLKADTPYKKYILTTHNNYSKIIIGISKKFKGGAITPSFCPLPPSDALVNHKT